jgi:hypothetical protein
MRMIAHQAPSVQLNSKFGRIFDQVVKIKPAVCIVFENIELIDPSLKNMIEARNASYSWFCPHMICLFCLRKRLA